MHFAPRYGKIILFCPVFAYTPAAERMISTKEGIIYDKPHKNRISGCLHHPVCRCADRLRADPISNQFEIAAMNIEYDFGLQAEDVVSYKGVKSNDNGDAGLVLVIEAADGKAEDIANQLTAYQQDQVAFYGNYAEFAQAQSNVENAVIAFKDNRVVMAIASNECTADLDSAVDSALNS